MRSKRLNGTVRYAVRGSLFGESADVIPFTPAATIQFRKLASPTQWTNGFYSH